MGKDVAIHAELRSIIDAALRGELTEVMAARAVALGPEDAGEGSLVEAALDDFAIEGVLCGGGCYADFDGNGTLDLFDFLAYVNSFNAGDQTADCDGTLDLFDFLCYVNKFNAGC